MCCHPAITLSCLCVRNEATTGGQFTKLDRPTGLLLYVFCWKNYFDWNFTKGFLGLRVNIGSGNGLTPDICQALTWTNDDSSMMHICFTRCQCVNLVCTHVGFRWYLADAFAYILRYEYFMFYQCKWFCEWKYMSTPYSLSLRGTVIVYELEGPDTVIIFQAGSG